MRRSHDRKRAWSVIWRALDGWPLNSLVDLSESQIYHKSIYANSLFIDCFPYIHTDIFLQRSRCTVDRSSSSVANPSGMRVTPWKAWRQGRYIRADAFTLLPVTGLTPSRPTKNCSRYRPFSILPKRPTRGTFRKRRWDIMLVSPCEQRLPR